MNQTFLIPASAKQDKPKLIFGPSSVERTYRVSVPNGSQPVAVLSSSSWVPKNVLTETTEWMSGHWLVAWVPGPTDDATLAVEVMSTP